MAIEEQGHELTAEWGEPQPNGDVYVYQQFADGSVELARIESMAANQGVTAPAGSAGGAIGGGVGGMTISDPNDIAPYWNEWLASGGSGDPQEFIDHYRRLFGQTPSATVVTQLAGGITQPKIKQPTVKPSADKLSLSSNYLEAMMANEAAQLGMNRSRGGFADWMNLATTPFNQGATRSQLINQLSQFLGWLPSQPNKFGVPEVSQLNAPDWLQNWIDRGYVGG